MVSTESIACSLESIDLKKANLRKTYDDLQAHSQFLSSFTLQWKDLEEHLESVQKSIERSFSELRMEVDQFNELKRKEKESISMVGSVSESPKQALPVKEVTKSSDDEPETMIVRPQGLLSFVISNLGMKLKRKDEENVPLKESVSSTTKDAPKSSDNEPETMIIRPQSKMDEMGLLSFVVSNLGKNLEPIKDELVGALSSASDPAQMVLNALYEFYPPNYDCSKKGELDSIRKTCIFLLERLNDMNVPLDPAVKEEAYNLATRWKDISSSGGRNEIEALGFLQLLVTYDLASSFKSDELIDIAVKVRNREEAIDLLLLANKALVSQFNELKLKDKEEVKDSVSFSGSVSSPKQTLPVRETPKCLDEEPETILRPQLKSLCSKMDAMGLLSFIITNQGKKLEPIRHELVEALSSASDPARLVLSAMYEFYPPNYDASKKGELAPIRKICIFLLENLYDMNILLEPAVKEEAFNLAMRWKEISSKEGQSAVETLGFLQLLATYDLASSFNSDELVGIAVKVGKRKEALDLCRSLGLASPDLIRNLCDNGRQLEAIKFACAFNVLDKFPPRPILTAYLKNAKKLAQEIRKNGNHSYQSQREATARECSAVKAMIKCIEEHNLESAYPLESLEKHVEDLTKQRPFGKRADKARGKHHQTSKDECPRPKSPLSQAQAPYYPGNQFPARQPNYSSSPILYGNMPGSNHQSHQDQGPLPPVSPSAHPESRGVSSSSAQQYVGAPQYMSSGPPGPYGGVYGASTTSYGLQQGNQGPVPPVSASPHQESSYASSSSAQQYAHVPQYISSGPPGPYGGAFGATSTTGYGLQQGSAMPNVYSYDQQHAAPGTYADFPPPL